jgi:hypothetical protein
MRLPQPTDYNEAIQNPQLCFGDEELRTGRVVTNPLGLPRPHAGNFADVYQINAPAGPGSWAVKCFTRSVEGLRQRYQAISEHLRRATLPFLIDFAYLEEGIRVRGDWFPVLKMRWVEGLTLNEFVRRHLDRPQLLEQLAAMWVRVARQLRGAGIAHADLQHGNVLLVASAKADRLGLRLIDYDGMFVPALAETPSGEAGHPNFQHPERLRSGAYHAEVDRFSHLVIYTALRALAAGGRPLWERYDNGENLLFREQDFREPAGSALFRELWARAEPEVPRLAAHLLLAGQGKPEEVPLLDELLGEAEPMPLTQRREGQVERVLTHVRRSPRTSAPAPAEAGPPPAEEGRPWWAAGPGGVAEAPPRDEGQAAAAAEPLAGRAGQPAAPAPPPPETLPAEAGTGQRPPPRPRQVRVFHCPAGGKSEEEHLGAAAGLLGRGRFAVACGTPDSPLSELWAGMLAEDFVEGRRPQPAPWSAWLPPLQLRWAAAASEDGALAGDSREEARASFLGLVVHPPGWLDGRRWEGVAVGDCALFQIRQGVLHRAFPHRRLADLEDGGARIGARTSFERVLAREEVRDAGDWSAGDELWLMTRPLARWFLRRIEEWQRPWEGLGALLDRGGSPRHFAAWVDELRAAGELADEDVSLVAVCL